MLISGLLEAAPAAIACAPLTARLQPLAAVLMTNAGAEIAMLAHGSGFVRMSHLDRLPVARHGERPDRGSSMTFTCRRGGWAQWWSPAARNS
jgi:hypothetical protein